MTEPAGPVTSNEGLARDIGAFGVGLIALNGMIGAGIFGVPAGAAALAGAWSPMVFVACGLALAAVMICFAEIASRFDRTGGPILYMGTAFGHYAGFQTGWAYYVARVTSYAANLNLLLASVAWLWPDAGNGPVRIGLIVLFVGLLAWINITGVKAAVRALTGLTVLKLIPLFALVVAGLGLLDDSARQLVAADAPSAADFGTAALLVVYAFVGWENALVPAGEVRNPARAVPRALFGALVVATAFYIAIQSISVAALPDLASSERALVDVAEALMGSSGALLLTVGVVVSVGANLFAAMISIPRLPYALARDGDLPKWFARLDATHRTPANAIVFTAVVVCLLSVFGSFLWLAAMSSLVRVLIYMGCITGMPRLRARAEQGDSSGFRVPGGWTIPIFALLACGLLVIQLSLQSLLATLSTVAVGSVIYLVMHRGRLRKTER